MYDLLVKGMYLLQVRNKIINSARSWWLSVLSSYWEAEIRRIVVQGHLGKYITRPPSSQ
jgi:hypothetical protein